MELDGLVFPGAAIRQGIAAAQRRRLGVEALAIRRGIAATGDTLLSPPDAGRGRYAWNLALLWFGFCTRQSGAGYLVPVKTYGLGQRFAFV